MCRTRISWETSHAFVIQRQLMCEGRERAQTANEIYNGEQKKKRNQDRAWFCHSQTPIYAKALDTYISTLIHKNPSYLIASVAHDNGDFLKQFIYIQVFLEKKTTG